MPTVPQGPVEACGQFELMSFLLPFQVLMNFEHHLSQATQALAREQQEKEQLEKERGLLECEAKELREALQAERQGRLKLQAECEQAEHGRLHERSQAEVLRAQLAEEQEAGVKRVRELEQWSAQREEQLQKEIEKERVATQRESQRGQDAQQVLSAVQDETRRLESELDAVSRDKESLRVELSLEKARFESQRVQSEAEFKVALEQQVTERLTALHEDSSHQMAVMREQHRKQIVEVTMQHEHEMGKQLAEFQQELQEREEKHRHVVEGYELRLAKGQEETSRLLAVNRKLQVQRSEMVSKLQAMMQSHWNEALRVLMSEHSPNAPPQLQPPALHHNQVSVYQELHRSLSSSEAQHSATSADRSLSSSSVPPCPSPTLDSERLQLFMSARGSGDSVAQSCLDQLVKTVQGSGPNLTEPILDHQAPRGGMESGQPPDMSARDPRFPGAVPLWPVTQISCWPVPVDRGVPPLQGLALAGWNGGRALELPPAVPRTQNGDQHQRPMLPDPHSVEDLSHLLNCSFLSRASFQPLEPQVDETIAAPEPPAEELAEHPFTDAEVGGQQPSEGVMAPDVSFSSSSSRSFQDQSSRSSELQYYIQMLLDRPPSGPLDANADAEPPNVMPQAAEPQQAGAPIILAHSSTWETARPQPMGQLSTSQNAKPLSSAVQKVKISPPQSVPTQRGFAQNPGLAGGVLSPKQVGQLSRLLSTYTGTSDRPAPSMDELFTYLRDVQDNRLIGPEILASTAQGNQDQKMNQTTKKEGVPAQKRFTNKPDKGSNSSKEKRRPLPSSQGGGSKGARLSIWR
ncbi:centrobin [Narcine bancroftii]|uniref:centrobin n=1 Tax=Narcine bancroftii TaxID=1343680 RepID=UPI0038322A63